MSTHTETGTVRIPTDKIFPDEGYQPRLKGLEEKHVRLLLSSDPTNWPPLAVAPSEDGYAIIDGFHRYEAAKRLGLKELFCWVEPSTGYPEAFEANMSHGLPLSIEDRKAYARWLHEYERPNGERLSYREIGRRCGLSDKTAKSAVEGTDAEIPQQSREVSDPVDRLFRAVEKVIYFDELVPSKWYVRHYIALFEGEYQRDVAESFAAFGRALVEGAKPYLR
jgi:hypothetical protein